MTSSVERDEASFFVALDGVTRYALFEACRKVFQNALGHGFFPSPPELRGLCDKAMEHHVAMRDRIERRQRAIRESPRDLPPLTDAEKQRQRERMARFHGSDSDKQAELAAIRAKYDPELLASVPDAPLPKGIVQVGKSVKA